MAVYTFNPLEDRRWTTFIGRHAHASVFHSTGWIEALRRSYGYDPVVFTTTPVDRPLTNGILFCRVDSWLTGRRMVSVPFADHCEPLVEPGPDRAELVEALRTCTAKDYRYVELRPRGSCDWITPGGEPAAAFLLHTLDLRPPLDALIAGFHKSAILRKVRRAEREGVRYEEGRSEGLLHDFYRLMLLTRRRHGVPPQSLAWFARLIECLQGAKIGVARWRGDAIAALFTIRHGRTVVYKYGCSDTRFHRLGGIPFLFWKTVVDAKQRGASSLDLGRTDLDNAGLQRFKERLGAESTALAYRRISLRYASRRGVWHEHANRAFPWRLVSSLPDWLFISAGRLLYPHIG